MGSAQAIHNAAQIIINAENEDAIVVVVSAISGITNLLLAFAQASKLNQTEAIDILFQIELRHFTIIQELFPIPQQGAILGKVKVMLNDLEDIDARRFIYNNDCIYHRQNSKTPLVVRGPGAGAEVTEAGIFADIISVASAKILVAFFYLINNPTTGHFSNTFSLCGASANSSVKSCPAQCS